MAVGVQQQDVFAAADALIQEGLRPTIERVRQKLGRGSPNTVSPYLDSWFQTLGPRLAGTSRPPESSTPGQIATLATKFWEAALTEARKELAPKEAALDHERLELANRTQAYLNQISELESKLLLAIGELGQAREQVLAWQEKDAASQALVATLAQDVRASNEAVHVSNQALAELKRVTAADTASMLQRHAATEKHWAMETHRAREAAKLEISQTFAGTAKLKAELQAAQLDLTSARADKASANQELKAQIRLTTEFKSALDHWLALESARANQPAPPRRPLRPQAFKKSKKLSR